MPSENAQASGFFSIAILPKCQYNIKVLIKGNKMDLNEYQTKIVEIWESDKTLEEELLFCCVGMAEEAGECMGKIKRAMRSEGFDRQGYLLELGDCLAYLAMAVHSQGMLLEDCTNFKDYVFLFERDFPGYCFALFREVTDLFDTHYMEDLDWLKDSFAMVLYMIKVNAEHYCQSALSEVMQLNLAKLYDRKARLGTLKGSGDSR